MEVLASADIELRYKAERNVSNQFAEAIAASLFLDSRQERLRKDVTRLNDKSNALRSLSGRRRSKRLESSVFIVRLELSKRLVHFVSHARMYSRPSMQDPVHGCFAAATQLRNFIN
jgi:hypothetical protein